MNSSKIASLCQRCLSKKVSNFGSEAKKFVFGQDSSRKLQLALSNMNTKCNLIGMVMAQQCNRVAALRLKRACQVIQLYQRLYGERLLLEKMKSNILHCGKGRKLIPLLSAMIFDWNKESIPDSEMQRLREEIEEVHKQVQFSSSSCDVNDTSEICQWEQIVNNPDFMVWRKMDERTQLYTYRVLGRFEDIPPQAFFNVQVDVPNFKDWDPNTIDVKIVEKDPESTSEVVHWVSKFPYPMSPRDYCYVRRCTIDAASNTAIVYNKATVHPAVPEKAGVVRVTTYSSQMVIKPYTTFDENGFEYLMTYCDDSTAQTNIPSFTFKWMASTGVRDFLEKLHRAALRKVAVGPSNTSGSSVDPLSSHLYSKMAHVNHWREGKPAKPIDRVRKCLREKENCAKATGNKNKIPPSRHNSRTGAGGLIEPCTKCGGGRVFSKSAIGQNEESEMK